MRFAVHAADGASREVEGSNIVPPFAEGTTIVGYSINDVRFTPAQPIKADGEPMVIRFEVIRKAFAAGAPRTVKPRRVVSEPAPLDVA